MFGGPAYSIVSSLWPPDVLVDECANYVNLSLDVLLAVTLVSFLLYRLVWWRLWRLEGATSVGSLRGPWWMGQIVGMSLQFIVSLMMGLASISDKPFGVVIAIILTAFFEAIVVFVLFWILSLITSPLRCWLAPPTRGFWLRLFRKN